MPDWIKQPTSLPPIPEGKALDPQAVVDLTIARFREEGYRVIFAEGGRVSINEPLTKTVRLARWAERTPYAQALLIVHEWTHARQFRGSFWQRVAKGVRYLLSRAARVAIEAEAKAQAAYTDFLMIQHPGWDLRLRLSVERATTKEQLAGLTEWRVPYLTLADPDELKAAIRRRVKELADAEEDARERTRTPRTARSRPTPAQGGGSGRTGRRTSPRRPGGRPPKKRGRRPSRPRPTLLP